MMPAAITLADLAEARKFQRLICWLLDLPRAGVHIGGGAHVGLGAAPDNTISDAPGWTTREVRFIRHPITGQLAVRVTPALRAAWNAKKDQIRPVVKTWVLSKLATEADLAADWLDPSTGETIEDQDPVPDATQVT